MGLNCYLAMTAGEIAAASALPSQLAWMACHFSPSGPGLTNLPLQLPSGSMVILDDSVPVCGHKPDIILRQLEKVSLELNISGILLDFQRPGNPETSAMVQFLTQNLPCPVGVSDIYGEDLDCPIFLPPVPILTPITEYLSPWKTRDIWLEAALSCTAITVTEKGSAVTPQFSEKNCKGCHCDTELYCHYTIETTEDRIRFSMQRTPDDLLRLLQTAKHLGISKTIGLYQELSDIE